MKEFIRNEDKIYVNVPYAEAYVAQSLMSKEDKPSAIACQYGDGF